MLIKPFGITDKIDLPSKRTADGQIVFYDHLGNSFPNRKALAVYHGFSCSGIILRRLQKNMTLEDALTPPVKKQKKKQKRAKPDPEIKNMCTKMGLDYYEVMEEIQAGATFEQACDVWDLETVFIFQGRKCKTFRSLKIKTGLPLFRLREIFKTAETWEGRTYLIYEAMKGNYHE